LAIGTVFGGSRAIDAKSLAWRLCCCCSLLLFLLTEMHHFAETLAYTVFTLLN